MDRMNIAIRPDIGASARIVQYNRLRYANILINRPVLILVERGTKPGDALLRDDAGAI